MREISEKYYPDAEKIILVADNLNTHNKATSYEAELRSWESDRDTRQRGVNWQFTEDDARVKLKRLYPTPIFDK
jgi:hypothetical protein